jgi:trehalose utilization protein
MSSMCRCGNAAVWEQTDEPEIHFDNGALSKVVYHMMCMTCDWAWRENHHVERSYMDMSHHEKLGEEE